MGGGNSNLCPPLKKAMNAVKATANWTAYYNAKLQPFASKYGAIWNVNISERVGKSPKYDFLQSILNAI
jgi:hypothetical protein